MCFRQNLLLKITSTDIRKLHIFNNTITVKLNVYMICLVMTYEIVSKN